MLKSDFRYQKNEKTSLVWNAAHRISLYLRSKVVRKLYLNANPPTNYDKMLKIWSARDIKNKTFPKAHSRRMIFFFVSVYQYLICDDNKRKVFQKKSLNS